MAIQERGAEDLRKNLVSLFLAKASLRIVKDSIAFHATLEMKAFVGKQVLGIKSTAISVETRV